MVASLDFYRRAVRFAHRTGTILVSDNPYADITFGGDPAPSMLAAEGAKEVSVEFNSLSKSYNMTGWRSGMAVGNPDLVGMIRSVKLNTDAGLFGAVQRASIVALEPPPSCIGGQDGYVPAAGPGSGRSSPDRSGGSIPLPGTFYAWAPLPSGTPSMDFFTLLLRRSGVVAIPGIGYGRHEEGFIRFSLTVPDSQLDEAMDRIESAAANLLP